MLTLLGVACPGARGGNGSPTEQPGRVLSAVANPPLPTEHWVLEDSSKGAHECSAGRRGATEEECLAAVQEAANGAGLQVDGGLRSVDDGASGVVPAGCSYSVRTGTAMFNTDAAGGVGQGNYRLVCRVAA